MTRRLLGIGVLAALTGCSRGPATLDIWIASPGPDQLQQRAVPSHVDLRRADGAWLRVEVAEPFDLAELGREPVVLTRASVPPGRYVAMRVGYVLAVPRPDLAVAALEPEDADTAEPIDTATPRDVVRADEWVFAPFCLGRGADLHLVIEPDPQTAGRTPRFDVASGPPC